MTRKAGGLDEQGSCQLYFLCSYVSISQQYDVCMHVCTWAHVQVRTENKTTLGTSEFHSYLEGSWFVGYLTP